MSEWKCPCDCHHNDSCCGDGIYVERDRLRALLGEAEHLGREVGYMLDAGWNTTTRELLFEAWSKWHLSKLRQATEKKK